MPSKIIVTTLLAAVFIAGATVAAPLASAAPTDDACSVLTQAQVSAALGVSVGAGTYVTPAFKKTCTWNTASEPAGGPTFVTVLLEDLNAYNAGKAYGAAKTVTITPVSGIGDDAYYLVIGNSVALIAKKGCAAFKLTVYSSSPVEKKEAMENTLAQQAVSKL